VYEDRLNPRLGRLIDMAKAASLRAGAEASVAEGVALLTESESIYVGHAGGDADRPGASAAEAALAAARQADGEKIVAAAVAVANDRSATVMPSQESRRCLAGLDPDLPLVVKQRGRWVLILLSELS